MNYDKYGFRDCCEYDCHHDYPYTWRKPVTAGTYSVLVRSNHNSTLVNGLSKTVAEAFLADWSSGKTKTLALNGTNVCYGVRSSCITEVTVTKE